VTCYTVPPETDKAALRGGMELAVRVQTPTGLSAVGRTVQALKLDDESTCDGGVIWKLQSGPARDLDSALLLST